MEIYLHYGPFKKHIWAFSFLERKPILKIKKKVFMVALIFLGTKIVSTIINNNN